MQPRNISSKTKLLALLGNPARHSLSPVIQNRFLSENNMDAVYMTFEFPENRFQSAFNGARDLGFIGLNITMPYKEKAFNSSQDRDMRADATGSVNAVRFDRDGDRTTVRGFNTDIDGILISLDNAGFRIKDSNCLILGAGGAARSAVFALLERNAGRINIYNRTVDNAKKIRDAAVEKDKIAVLDDLEAYKEAKDLELIMNFTPQGMDTGGFKDMMPVPEGWDLKGKTVFESIYAPLDTRFMQKARKEGAIIVDGLDMLINGAAASFEKWFDIFPDTDNIKKELLSN